MKIENRKSNEIALALQRSRSAISRKLTRNNSEPRHEFHALAKAPAVGEYNAKSAGRRAAQLRDKPCHERKLQAEVRRHVFERHLPEQISAELKRTCPDEPALNASHETVYNGIYVLPHGELKCELGGLLRQGRDMRKPCARGEDRRGELVNAASILVRSPEANERLIAGHWEVDLIKGVGNRSAVSTLIDRSTPFLMRLKMEIAVLTVYNTAFAPLHPDLHKTLTYDHGKEVALHKQLVETTVINMYFCDPHSCRQPGIDENTSGLLRQFLPQSATLSKVTQRKLGALALNVNRRARRTFGRPQPGEVLIDNCAKQGVFINAAVVLGI